MFSEGSSYPPCSRDMKQLGCKLVWWRRPKADCRILRIFCHCLAVCLGTSGLPSLGSIVNGDRGTEVWQVFPFLFPGKASPGGCGQSQKD